MTLSEPECQHALQLSIDTSLGLNQIFIYVSTAYSLKALFNASDKLSQYVQTCHHKPSQLVGGGVF